MASAATDALEAARAARAGSSAKEAALRAAASARLKLGDVRGYCELSRDVGDWDAALAAAPAVSLAFWAELASSRADALAKDDDGNLDDVVHLRLAAGRVDAAVEALQGAGRDDDAFLVACTADEGLLRAPPRDEETSGAETTTGRTGATTTGTTDAPSIDGAPTSASSAPSTPARERSRSSTLENVSTLAAALPSTLGRPRNSLPAIGAARGNAALSPLPPLGAKPRSRRYTPPTDTLDATIPRAEGWREAPCGGRRETPFADRDPLDPYTSPPFARRRARRD